MFSTHQRVLHCIFGESTQHLMLIEKKNIYDRYLEMAIKSQPSTSNWLRATLDNESGQSVIRPASERSAVCGWKLLGWNEGGEIRERTSVLL